MVKNESVRPRSELSTRTALPDVDDRPPHGPRRLVLAMSAWSSKPDVLRPDIVGMRRAMVIRLQPHMTMRTPRPPRLIVWILVLACTKAQGTHHHEGTIIDVQVELSTSICLLYTSPSPRDLSTSRMPSSA